MTKGKPKAEARKSPPAEKSAATALAAQLRAAAEQRRLVEPWLDDRNFVESSEGGTVLYAVDSNIVKLFTDPYRMSIARGPRPGYAEIIPGQEDEVSVALGWILANFIFTKLSGEWPVFILPPAHDEISEIFSGVARNAEKEKSKALLSIRRLENWIREKEKAIVDKSYFEDHLQDILTVLAGEKSFSAELVRFSRLINSNKLFMLDQYLLESRLPDETLRGALMPPTGIHEMVAFGQLIKDWESEIGKFKWAATRQARSNDVDARMLARLEWINSKLESTKFRFVLITGSHLIEEVAREYKNQNFGERFIRSPKAYLGDPKVVSPILDKDVGTKLEEGRRLQDWLNTVLGADERESPDRESYLKLIDRLIASDQADLERIAAEKLKLNPGLAKDIDEKWRAFAKEVSTMATQTETQRRLEGFEKDVLPTRDQVAALRGELEQSLKVSWDEVYKAALGSALTVSRKPEEAARAYPPRNFPLVYLDNHPKTNAAIEQYLRAWQVGQLTPDVYRQLRDAPTGDPDYAPYLEFFAQAYVLGVTNRWHISAVTAALAVSVARDYRERHPADAKLNRISGREAAFWRAHVLRNYARAPLGLTRARVALQLARQYGREDMEDAEGNLDFRPIRFDAEELAIDVAELCFELFSTSPQPKPSPVTINKAVRTLAKAAGHLENLCKEKDLTELISQDTYGAFSFQRIITNYFMVALSIHRDYPMDNAAIRKYLGQFKLFVEHLKPVPTNSLSYNSLSYLVLIIYETATVIFSTDEQQRRTARSEFRKLHNDMAKNMTMPYDANRFEFLADLVHTSR